MIVKSLGNDSRKTQVNNSMAWYFPAISPFRQGNNSFQKKHHTMHSLEVWDGLEFLQKLGIDPTSMEKVHVIEALQ